MGVAGFNRRVPQLGGQGEEPPWLAPRASPSPATLTNTPTTGRGSTLDIGTDNRRPHRQPADAREKEMPRRLLAVARDALLGGFMVVIDQRVSGAGWRIVIRDERHCMHLTYVPSKPDRVDRHGPWSHTRSGMWGTCAAQPDRTEVRPAQISDWLANHPHECKGDDYAADLDKYHGCHCTTAEAPDADQHSA